MALPVNQDKAEHDHLPDGMQWNGKKSPKKLKPTKHEPVPKVRKRQSVTAEGKPVDMVEVMPEQYDPGKAPKGASTTEGWFIPTPGGFKGKPDKIDKGNRL